MPVTFIILKDSGKSLAVNLYPVTPPPNHKLKYTLFQPTFPLFLKIPLILPDIKDKLQ